MSTLKKVCLAIIVGVSFISLVPIKSEAAARVYYRCGSCGTQFRASSHIIAGANAQAHADRTRHTVRSVSNTAWC